MQVPILPSAQKDQVRGVWPARLKQLNAMLTIDVSPKVRIDRRISKKIQVRHLSQCAGILSSLCRGPCRRYDLHSIDYDDAVASAGVSGEPGLAP